ncbi:hypothetical protein R3W88_014644 [Solanum pinnatisectum]|uniref:Uncharacterized protein n=1 Tax=Solanum pinnatisectum TaxID=50273 RepID=A0AAV9KS91_9SOLN|nr:hypothetical protein R3W88_014644 [Solanum pinnatisectum]
MRPVIRPGFGTKGPFQEKGKETDKKPSASPFAIRPSLNSPNKFSALASLPPINPSQVISPFPSLPPSASSSSPLILKKPFLKESEPCSFSPSGKPRFSSPQTKDSYTMKAPESFKEAVSPSSNKSKEREVFDIVTLQVNPILALDKEFEGYEVKHLLKPCYTNRNYVDTENPLKTRKYYEFILVDTGSIEVEHKLSHDSDPDSIAYSKFTIKRVFSPFDWIVDHLHTPVNLSREHRPQTYNWYDYKNAWFNFLYLRPTTHTWFVKYSPKFSKSVIPRWFYEWWNCFGGNQKFRYLTGLNISQKRYSSKDGLQLPEGIQRFSTASTSGKRSSSKNDLKKRLQKALSDLDEDKSNEETALQLLEEASSQSDDNGDMLRPKALALSYLDPFYD